MTLWVLVPLCIGGYFGFCILVGKALKNRFR